MCPLPMERATDSTAVVLPVPPIPYSSSRSRKLCGVTSLAGIVVLSRAWSLEVVTCVRTHQLRVFTDLTDHADQQLGAATWQLELGALGAGWPRLTELDREPLLVGLGLIEQCLHLAHVSVSE